MLNRLRNRLTIWLQQQDCSKCTEGGYCAKKKLAYECEITYNEKHCKDYRRKQ